VLLSTTIGEKGKGGRAFSGGDPVATRTLGRVREGVGRAGGKLKRGIKGPSRETP